MQKPKKMKKVQPQLDPNIPDYKHKLNFNIEKAIQPDKINPNKIFEGYSDKSKKNQKAKGRKNPKMRK